MKARASATAKTTSFVWILCIVVLLSVLSTSAAFAMSKSPSPDAAAAASLDEDSANLKRWASRWSENNLGWHRDYIHPSLKAHGDKILPAPIATHGVVTAVDSDQETCKDEEAASASSYRIFFPLCGKSIDMAHLASLDSVSQVVGLDGIEKALLEFAKENPQLEIAADATVSSSSSSSNSYTYFNGKKIQLIKGDFFALDSTDTAGRFEAIYDRASMVAVEPALRLDYVAVMGRLIKPGGKILLVTIERDDDAGPPFSVTQSHVEQLYQGLEWVESITALEGGRDADDRFVEGIYLIQAKK